MDLERNMNKEIQVYAFSCFTLLRQDIDELIQLFQIYLQDSEIIIDDLHILKNTQLEQFDATYQAQSLIARGYYHEPAKGGTKDLTKGRLIELKISKQGARVWFHWGKSERAEPEVSVRIKQILSRGQNGVQQFLQIVVAYMFWFMPLSLLSVFQHYSVNDIPQILLTIVLSFLFVVLACLSFIFIIRFLHIEPLIFMLPGVTQTTRVYGMREAIGKLIVALVLIIAFDVLLLIVLHILRR